MSEILDRTAYQRPASFSEATGRMQKNLNYFKINYILFTAVVLAAFIMYHPSSLVMLGAISAAWGYVYMVRTEPLKIGERPVSDREKFLGMSGASILAVFFMSSAGERDVVRDGRRAAVHRRAQRGAGAGRSLHRRQRERERFLLVFAAAQTGAHGWPRVTRRRAKDGWMDEYYYYYDFKHGLSRGVGL